MKTRHEKLINRLNEDIQCNYSGWINYSCEALAKLCGYRFDDRYVTKTFKPKLRKLFRDAGYSVSSSPHFNPKDHVLTVNVK